jgi:UDP-N-acetylglucosamine 2-epimerase (non-hydrolysing)
MPKLTVMSVFGTRPEVIKTVPVIKELERRPETFRSITVLTGQHKEMCEPFLERFELRPDHDLAIMEPNQTPDTVVSNVLRELPAVMERTNPDVVLVQGDTSSAFAAALAAYHRKAQVGHIEAGLRTRNKFSPFPEEINRHLVGVLADWHFAPTTVARENLLSERVPAQKIFVTGNTVIDALMEIVDEQYEFEDEALMAIDFRARRVICVTTHRRENFGGPLENIVQALRQIVARFDDVEIVLPVHFNPNVREHVYGALGGVERVHLIDPLSYEPFVQLMARSYLILTDSGGVQEEAPSLGKPVLVLRDTTERPEGIEVGTAKLAGVRSDEIVASTSALLEDRDVYLAMSRKRNPYGDGHAGERIVDILERQLAAE